MLSVNRRFFDPSVSREIMSRASGKFSAVLKSCGQCLPVVFSKWQLVLTLNGLCIKEEIIISHCRGFELKMAEI
jgi:hypothetical protein